MKKDVLKRPKEVEVPKLVYHDYETAGLEHIIYLLLIIAALPLIFFYGRV